MDGRVDGQHGQRSNDGSKKMQSSRSLGSHPTSAASPRSLATRLTSFSLHLQSVSLINLSLSSLVFPGFLVVVVVVLFSYPFPCVATVIHANAFLFRCRCHSSIEKSVFHIGVYESDRSVLVEVLSASYLFALDENHEPLRQDERYPISYG